MLTRRRMIAATFAAQRYERRSAIATMLVAFRTTFRRWRQRYIRVVISVGRITATSEKVRAAPLW